MIDPFFKWNQKIQSFNEGEGLNFLVTYEEKFDHGIKAPYLRIPYSKP